jgi:hypothetical protein
MSVDFARCIPVLASLDIAETRDFYVGTADRQFPENTSCYIRGGQVPVLYEEFRQRGVPRLSPFEVRPWNMKEFYIHDPHGNLLRFGCGEW